ncbi:MAG: FAD/NAD(P)-binding protein [Parcubacteria group bacterium]|nr:FAD/NAD(P)-binding protein [Parcubacteria group bacterium]
MNQYKPLWAKIKKIKNETDDIRLFVLELEKKVDFIPGQFCLVGIPGFGEAPLDICSSTGKGKTIEVVIRRAGMLTEKIFTFKSGDRLTFRGPYGNGFPALKNFENRDLLMIGGGTAIIVIRGLIREMIDKKFKPKGKVQIFYGARDWDVMLFRDEFKEWKKYFDLHLILENTKKAPLRQGSGGQADIVCNKGLITHLFDIAEVSKNPRIIMCGPPVMYKFCMQKIAEKLNVPEDDIYLSLERRMHCGVGVCQHCAIGEKYVCKDGTVFTYKELKKIPGAL